MEFGIKDIIDILITATVLFYTYKTMKESGTLNIFLGVLAFIVLWIVVSKILDMQLIGSIMDKFINIGLIIIVILFQEQIKKFLVELGSKKRWSFFRKIFSRKNDSTPDTEWIIPVVYACMSMSKSKTGALIVIEQKVPLENYERTGDRIDAKINTRLIENIFFKNSPLHDGALIISNDKLAAAGCIMPVSHDTSLPRYLGLRHRAALGIAQATDAIAVIVSEETGNISLAYKGQLYAKLNSTDLEKRLSQISI
ncbi:MAG: TIGR00159 family protein [Bacteroidales bacterium]|nr:TIGR00159 family protein [Bacteroidales bacterium]